MIAQTEEKNILSSAPIGRLMLKYAIPSVVALVVNALYNIVDQVFIGWGVGTLGNSATYAAAGGGRRIDLYLPQPGQGSRGEKRTVETGRRDPAGCQL